MPKTESAAASLGIDDLILSHGAVAQAAAVDGDTAECKLVGVSKDATLAVTMAAVG